MGGFRGVSAQGGDPPGCRPRARLLRRGLCWPRCCDMAPGADMGQGLGQVGIGTEAALEGPGGRSFSSSGCLKVPESLFSRGRGVTDLLLGTGRV